MRGAKRRARVIAQLVKLASRNKLMTPDVIRRADTVGTYTRHVSGFIRGCGRGGIGGGEVGGKWSVEYGRHASSPQPINVHSLIRLIVNYAKSPLSP